MPSMKPFIIAVLAVTALVALDDDDRDLSDFQSRSAA